MSARPAATPGLLAELAAAAPARLVRKLDQAPRLAEGWAWDLRADGTVAVGVEGRDIVMVRPEGGVVSSPGQLSCTCLLSPRCLHVLAVAAALPIAEGTGIAAVPAAGPGTAPAQPAVAPPACAAEEVPLDEAQRAASATVLRVLGELLGAGALGSGTVLQGEALRALHAARVTALPRLSGALLRVIAALRACRSRDAAFELGAFVADLGEAIVCAHVLAGRIAASPRWIGVARRTYAPAGTLRFHGLFSEPVLSGGYAGVVTYLLGPGGALFSVGDVAPGTIDRIAGAYRSSARLGAGAIVHAELARSGLFVEGATVSADGRLGAGQGIRAVKAAGAALGEPPLDVLFAQPLPDQVARAFAAVATDGERRAGDDLLFLDGTVRGARGDALLLDVSDPSAPVRPVIEGVPASTAPELSFRDNLGRLASASGFPLRVVGRLVADRPLRIALLAAAAGPGADPAVLALPPEWGRRCNLGLDRLPGAALASRAGAVEGPPASPAQPSAAVDALVSIERRVGRLALGGRQTFAAGAFEEALREARALRDRLMPGAADVLAELGAAARATAGARPERLAVAFGAASSYLRVAGVAAQEAAWIAALGDARP